MSGGGGGRRTSSKAPAQPEKPPPEKPAAEKRPGRAAAAPAASPAKAKKGVAAAPANARQDALEEAQDMAQAVANDDEGIKDKSASPPPAARRTDRAMTLELQKEKAERAKLLAETELLRKQLDAYTVRESKRKQSEAAEKAPPAKRAAGSGRRTTPQSAGISRKRLSVCTSISVIDFLLHNHDSIIMTLLF